ncbi:PAS domain-containing methyl-accepting chemotaxis protein [Methylophaga sp. OBS1]|nr:PAS domain-containing methyl-accepting chemotaxis protein [Methylophaga sp. OBS1]MCX4191377.1 PAS domain-containing methyl-accepting chemotaxis protein [Methylophaga sp. OBS1]MCX4191677.1 PAS domain-containing methyl-accepting chemotaxis protein [Methylophaga sp. OBS1]
MFNKISRTKQKNKDRNIDISEQQKVDTRQSLLALNEYIPLIEFSTDGNIISANELFLELMQYSLDELRGVHHRVFCTDDYSSSTEYESFWTDLALGEAKKGVFHRITKTGSDVWLDATYFPVKNDDGEVYKIIKIANDVTEEHEQLKHQSALVDALKRSLAFIEFDHTGRIIDANHNFCTVVGYNFDEIRGQEHRIFCPDEFIEDYESFWRSLAAGEFKSGLFKRLDKYGQTIWLEATYNPVVNSDGSVEVVVKFASDVTERINQRNELTKTTELAYQTAQNTLDVGEEGILQLDTASKTAINISNTVDKAAQVMNELAQQSQQISEIVTTISQIASQTNLLSLNAAIEAARAGESGKGFAVVADEVRKLASNTSDATVEISEIVQKNSQLTEKSSEYMEAIHDLVEGCNEQLSHTQNTLTSIKKGSDEIVSAVSNIIKRQQY